MLSVHKQSLKCHKDNTMIRKNSLFIKLLKIKTSSNFLFESYMNKFNPELETCPVCNSTNNCSVHAYYDRYLTDFCNGRQHSSCIRVLRLVCSSCAHTHAVLPDLIIPYRTYSLFFILRVLAEHFLNLSSVESICDRFDISAGTFYQWLRLWHEHKAEWLGILSDLESSDYAFLKHILRYIRFSDFLMPFYRKTAVSFMQSHRNPRPPSLKTALYRQENFSPDYDIF